MSRPSRMIGRYALFDAIASGGMATVHIARLVGPHGFVRTYAVKRLHAHLAKDAEFRSMFVDEARLAARIQHPNVVPTVDVVAEHGELFLVMEYVAGESLSRLVQGPGGKRAPVVPAIASAIVSGLLHGLHAAHEATNEAGTSLRLVHRDVSPQNVLVGVDGRTSVLDFGVAKAVGRLRTTRDGSVKGKLGYMAPEQLRGGAVTRQSDVYAAAVLFWELLAGRRLFTGADDKDVIEQILVGLVDPPGKYVPSLPEAVDELVLRGLDFPAERRFASAREMALALEACLPPASPSEVGAWVATVAGEALAARAARVAAAEACDLEEATATLPELSRALAPFAPRRGRRKVALVVATTMLLGGTAAVVAGRRPPPDRATAVRDVATPAPPPATSAEDVGIAVALPAAAETAAVRPTPLRSSVPRPHRAVDPCRVPYEIQADGRKIYKRNCL